MIPAFPGTGDKKQDALPFFLSREREVPHPDTPKEFDAQDTL
jgi:hypothetical protein